METRRFLLAAINQVGIGHIIRMMRLGSVLQLEGHEVLLVISSSDTWYDAYARVPVITLLPGAFHSVKNPSEVDRFVRIVDDFDPHAIVYDCHVPNTPAIWRRRTVRYRFQIAISSSPSRKLLERMTEREDVDLTGLLHAEEDFVHIYDEKTSQAISRNEKLVICGGPFAAVPFSPVSRETEPPALPSHDFVAYILGGGGEHEGRTDIRDITEVACALEPYLRQQYGLSTVFVGGPNFQYQARIEASGIDYIPFLPSLHELWQRAECVLLRAGFNAPREAYSVARRIVILEVFQFEEATREQFQWLAERPGFRVAEPRVDPVREALDELLAEAPVKPPPPPWADGLLKVVDLLEDDLPDRIPFEHARKNLASLGSEATLTLRIDAVSSLDVPLCRLLEQLRTRRLPASLEIVPERIRFDEDDLVQLDPTQLFEVSQHGFGHVSMYPSPESPGKLSLELDLEDLSGDDLEPFAETFQAMQQRFPSRFRGGFSPPFAALPAWVSFAWSEVGGRYISTLEAPRATSPIPVIRAGAELWDRKGERLRTIGSILAEVVMDLERCSQAGLVLRSHLLEQRNARELLIRILDFLLDCGLRFVPSSGTASSGAAVLVGTPNREYRGQRTEKTENRAADLGTVVCHRPWTGFEVDDHLGEVRPCSWGKLSCGSLDHGTPEEIWRGSGFRHYRQRMLAGDHEAICKDECPVLNGLYRERLPETQAGNITPLGVDAIGSPVYLSLGQSHHQSILDDWLPTAHELYVRGADAFVTEPCLDLFAKAMPEEYPQLGLAAVTDGMGFTPKICDLIVERRWHWILVPIDAATEATFRRVRGGELRDLLLSLERLARTRTCEAEPFVLLFGFTLQSSNLDEAVAFLDLCERYGALPQYTLDDETLRSQADHHRFFLVLEELDKALFHRGFDSRMLAGPLRLLLKDARRLEAGSSAVSEPEVIVGSSRETSTDRPVRLELGGGLSEDQVKTLVRQALRAAGGEDRQTSDVVLVVDRHLCQHWPAVEEVFSAAAPNRDSSPGFLLELPYWSGEQAISALDFRKTLNQLRESLEHLGWGFRGGSPRVADLGFRAENASPGYEVVLDTRGDSVPELSVITANYNHAPLLQAFLSSLARQTGSPDFELVLVDDGSRDASVATFCDLAPAVDLPGGLLLLRLDRQEPYVPGTFTFRAGMARQVGVEHARGELLLFLDPDEVVHQACVDTHLHYLRWGFDVVIGDREESTTETAGVSLWRKLRLLSLRRQEYWWPSFFTGNSSVRREMFERVGGFDVTLQYWGLDDTDLGYRLARGGALYWHTPRACVTHSPAAPSGGGSNPAERFEAFRVHMEVLYRKYLDEAILDAHAFIWPTRNRREEAGPVAAGAKPSPLTPPGPPPSEP